MIEYPRALYKTKEDTIDVQNEAEHRKMASEGWKNHWIHEAPQKFEKIVEVKAEVKKKVIKKKSKKVK